MQNAIIESASIFIEDHGILTYGLYLGYADKGVQMFGGYILSHDHIKKILEVVGVLDWKDLSGKAIRVECTFNGVSKIGHITKDKWFSPKSN